LYSRVAQLVSLARTWSLLENLVCNHHDQRPTARSIEKLGGKSSDHASKDSVLLIERFCRGREEADMNHLV